MGESFFSAQISEDNNDWAGEDIDLTEDGGAIIAVDNGQFGFLRIENVQNSLIIDNKKPVTDDFELLNFPNPFNSSTTIKYQLNYKNYVRLNIFDVTEMLYSNLLISIKMKVHSMVWRGINDQGMTLPSGIYFNRIK